MEIRIRTLVIASMFVYLACLRVQASEDEESRTALVDQILELQGAHYLGEEYTRLLIEGVRSVFESAEIDTESEYFASLSNVIDEVVYDELVLTGELRQTLVDELAPFGVEELSNILEFYKTPTGRKLIELAPKNIEANLQKQVEIEQKLSGEIEKRLQLRFDENNFDQNTFGLLSVEPEDLPSSTELAELTDENCVDEKVTVKRLPVYRGPPKYPYLASLYSVEGWVDVDFTIRKDGKTEDIRVFNSSTGQMFDDSAIAAVKNYVYCPGETAEESQLRIKFEMENESVEGTASRTENRPPRNTKKLAFLESEQFQNDLEDFRDRKSRKALAVADDGGDRWVSSWQFRHRFQSEANAAALKSCLRRRLDAKIEAPCRLFIEGEEIVEAVKDEKLLEQIEALIKAEDYEENSNFELVLADYDSQLFAKAMALAENENGAYYYQLSWSWPTQEEANIDALEKCNESKPDHISSDCYLYKVGDYRGHEVPKLNSMVGVWEGSVDKEVYGVGSVKSGSSRVRIENCGEHPKVLIATEEKPEFFTLHRLFDIAQDNGNIVLSSLEDGGDWVETQVWTLVELSDDTAAVQWNRMVSNVELKLDEELRQFGSLAAGSINKIEECDITESTE